MGKSILRGESTSSKRVSLDRFKMYNGKIFDFDLDVIDGIYKNSMCNKAFYALYTIMQK